MAGGGEHLELAVRLRDLARQADLPSARRALVDLATHFDRMAERYSADWHTRLVHPIAKSHRRWQHAPAQRGNTMAASPKLIITEAEHRFPCRIKVGVPTGGFGYA